MDAGFLASMKFESRVNRSHLRPVEASKPETMVYRSSLKTVCVLGRADRHRSLMAWMAGWCLLASGCGTPSDSFNANELVSKRFELTESIPMAQVSDDAGRLLTELFGTPDEPCWPDCLSASTLVDPERLRRAAGPVYSDEDDVHWGLYREHCVTCHGVNGNGIGPAAVLLNPYPRNFLLGKFKFKNTRNGSKPTRQDLRRLLTRGIMGTSMPSFRLLSDGDADAIVDYVIYLSVRGETERALLQYAAYNLDVDLGERLYEPDLQAKNPDLHTERLSLVEDMIREISDAWELAERHIVADASPPEGFPLVGQSGHDAEQVRQSIANGQRLFQGTVAGCAFCHGANAEGDGQQNNYDDWTREWTVLAGLNPSDKEQLRPMLDLGALKPRNILPRNLRHGLFRGGDSPAELYTRIVCGIEGTPMPAVPVQPENPQGLSPTEVWDLVNFLLSLRAEAKAAEETVDG